MEVELGTESIKSDQNEFQFLKIIKFRIFANIELN
jgi:hypothetical protein